MTTMFVRHTVADYKAWRKVYDSVGDLQTAGGVTAKSVYQAVDNPNDVTVTHDFATADAARAFASSDGLKSAMQRAGIVGAPTIWITSKA